MASKNELINNESFDYGLAAIHIFVAVVFGLFFADSGQTVKFILFPYLVLTLMRPKKEVLPGLTLLMCYGTILTILAAVVIMIISFTKIQEMKEKKLFPLWILLVVAFVFHGYNITIRLTKLNYSLVDAFVLYDYFFAFVFLLYGALNPHLVTKKSISLLLFTTMFLLFFDIVDSNKQLGFRSLYRLRGVSESAILLFLFLVSRRMIPLNYDYFVRLSIVVYILTRLVVGFPIYKFTFIMGFLISLSLIFQKRFYFQNYIRNQYERILKTFSFILTIIPIPFLFITIVITPIYASQYEIIEMNNYYGGEENLFDIVMAKLFVDRGLLWVGAIAGIAENATLLPPLEEWTLGFTNLKEAYLEVQFEAHNLLLELIRKNGYFFGVVLSITYLRWQYRLVKSVQGGDPYINVFRYAIFGIAIAVFTTGQYTLNLATCFYFMTLTGALAMAPKEVVEDTKKTNNEL